MFKTAVHQHALNSESVVTCMHQKVLIGINMQIVHLTFASQIKNRTLVRMGHFSAYCTNSLTNNTAMISHCLL